METKGWIFMIGFRVFDVGLLILWLIWFFRLRDDDPPDDDGGGGGGPDPGPREPGGGGGLGLPLGWARQSGRRLRDDHRPPHAPRRRGAEPVPQPLPARVRRHHPLPTPAHRTR